MSRVSELIGYIDDPTPKLNRICGDEALGDALEQFYSIDVALRECSIPIIISEHFLDQIPIGKVRITGSLFSDYESSQLPTFYIFCNKIESVDPETPISNVVNFSGTVTKVKPLTVDAAGRDVLPMILSDTSPLNTDSVLYLSLKNQNARVNKDRQPRFKVQGSGYIKAYRDIYEIHVQQIDFID